MKQKSHLHQVYLPPKYLSNLFDSPKLPVAYPILSSLKTIVKKFESLRPEQELLRHLLYLQKNQHKGQKWWSRIQNVQKIGSRFSDELDGFLSVCEPSSDENGKGKGKQIVITPSNLLISLERLLRAWLLIEKAVEVASVTGRVILQFLATKAFMPLSSTLTAILARIAFLQSSLKMDLEEMIFKYGEFIQEMKPVIDLTCYIQKLHPDLQWVWIDKTNLTLDPDRIALEHIDSKDELLEEDVGTIIDRVTIEVDNTEAPPISLAVNDLMKEESASRTLVPIIEIRESQRPKISPLKRERNNKSKEGNSRKKRKAQKDEIDDIFGGL